MCKIDMPKSNTTIIWTHQYLNGMWLDVAPRRDTQNDTCYTEIDLSAQNVITIPGSIVNTIGGDLYDHLMSTKILTLKMNAIFI